MNNDWSIVVGPLIGVSIPFLIDRIYDWYRDKANKKKLKQNLKAELEKCLELLTGEGKLLPVMMWSSTITSGDVKLLSFEERTKLSHIYFEIDNHNYEAKRVRDSAVIAQVGNSHIRVNGMTPAQAHWVRLSKALLETEATLKQKISNLLEETLWE